MNEMLKTEMENEIMSVKYENRKLNIYQYILYL